MATKRKIASHVTWTEIQRVLLYCERARQWLGLSDWGVGVCVDKCDADAHANIDTARGKRFASLYLAEDWMEKPNWLKRRVLLHEMLHLIHQRQRWALEDDVVDQTDITTDHEHRILGSYLRESEYMVDGLATALADAGILPEWPTKAEARERNLDNREP